MTGNKFILIAYGVLVGLIFSGLILLLDSPPKTGAIELIPPPTPLPMKVFISGSVNQPGVYHLKPDSRLMDLIEAAGGTSLTDLSAYNLASQLYDGQHVHLSAEIVGLDQPSISVDKKVNINEADLKLLQSLPGIGETKAQEIIKYREQNGFFTQIKDILNVPGIGDYTYDLIKDLIVTNQPYE